MAGTDNEPTDTCSRRPETHPCQVLWAQKPPPANPKVKRSWPSPRMSCIITCTGDRPWQKGEEGNRTNNKTGPHSQNRLICRPCVCVCWWRLLVLQWGSRWTSMLLNVQSIPRRGTNSRMGKLRFPWIKTRVHGWILKPGRASGKEATVLPALGRPTAVFITSCHHVLLLPIRLDLRLLEMGRLPPAMPQGKPTRRDVRPQARLPVQLQAHDMHHLPKDQGQSPPHRAVRREDGEAQRVELCQHLREVSGGSRRSADAAG